MSSIGDEATAREQAEEPKPPRIPKKFRPLMWTLTVLSVCCLGAVISIVQLLSDQSNGDEGLMVPAGCGNNLAIDTDGEFPEIGPYSSEQIKNAAIIIKVGQDLGIPARGWVVAVATAMQESGLTNHGHLGDRNDHDSQGLFQQRPSSGWGTPEQITDPVYASTKFYEKLQTIEGWEQLALTVAAQRVQISAFPNAYAKHEPLATQIVDTLTGGGARVPAVDTEGSGTCTKPGELSASGWMAPVQAPVWSGFQTPERPTHNGVDLGAERGTPVYAASSGTVITSECNASLYGAPYSCDVDGSPEVAGCGWYVNIIHAGDYLTRYCHFQTAPQVKEGDVVQAGQLLGYVGTSGRSSGPHLHFETHLNADRSAAGAVDPVAFMNQMGAPLG